MLKEPESVAATVVAPAQLRPEPAVTSSIPATSPVGPDVESRTWISELAIEGSAGEQARRRLHELLLRAARFELNRRRGSHPHLRGGDLDDLAHQAAGDAMLAILGKLDTY